MNPPKTNAWMGESAQTLYRHKDGGLDGVRCAYYSGPWVGVRVALTWDCVTCPDCLKLKQAWEPQSVFIDTKGD